MKMARRRSRYLELTGVFNRSPHPKLKLKDWMDLRRLAADARRMFRKYGN